MCLRVCDDCLLTDFVETAVVRRSPTFSKDFVFLPAGNRNLWHGNSATEVIYIFFFILSNPNRQHSKALFSWGSGEEERQENTEK